MNNKIYKITFLLLIAIIGMGTAISIVPVYINDPESPKHNYEITINCAVMAFAENYPKKVAANYNLSIPNEIKRCSGTIIGLRIVIERMLKEGKYVNSLTQGQKKDIDTIISKQLHQDVIDLLTRKNREFIVLFNKNKLTKKEDETYSKILNIEQRTNILIEEISNYLQIKDA